MKNTIFAAVALIATLSLAACSDIEHSNGSKLTEKDLPTLSLSHQMTLGCESYEGCFLISNAEFKFGSYEEHGSIISTSDENNTIFFSVPENKDGSKKAYTRDMEFYVDIYAYGDIWGNIQFGDYGVFNHPVHIRQTGESGTKYLSGGDYKDLVSNSGCWDENGYIYLKGKVETVSEVYASPKNVWLRNGEQLAKDVSCFDLTVRTDDGVSVKLRVNELSKDDILKNLKSKLATGKTVEICLYRAAYDNSFGGLVDISALEVFLVE